MVGEIGIDGVAKNRTTGEKYDFEHQMLVFSEQMRIAGEVGRGVNIHAVQCHGRLLEYFRGLGKGEKRKKGGGNGNGNAGGENVDSNLMNDSTPPTQNPPAIILHSISGSPEIIKSLLSLPSRTSSTFYFSISTGLNTRSLKCDARIQAVPDDRVLLESDLHDAVLVDNAMWGACALVGKAKGWGLEETAERTVRNAAMFLKKCGG